MAQLTVTSPYDHRVLQTIPLQNVEQIQAKLAVAHETFSDKQNWLTPAQRANILEKFLQLLQVNRDELANLAAAEGGKPLRDSQVEADRAIQGVKVAIERISQLTGYEVPMGLNQASLHHAGYTLREPVGVVLAISAFNHPINLIIHQVIPAVAVGCPVLVKPASTTPLSCLKIINLLHEAGLPEAWCQPIVCSSQVAEQLVQDERISFLTFIGSAKVGWHLRSLLSPGAHCALEHGGAAPVVITKDADIADALPLLTKGGFYHAGQVCVSVQRVFVDESIAESVAQRLADQACQLKVGDPLDEATEVGPLIEPKEVERIAEWVNSAIAQGAQLLCGGEKLPNNCYAPTVLYNPPLDHAVSQQEIFGPVICVYSYQDYKQAIATANDVPFAFQSAVFTKNIDQAWYAVKHLDARTVLINEHTAFRVDWMPFGGRKHSGLGVGGIPYTMLDMMHEKLMVWRSPAL